MTGLRIPDNELNRLAERVVEKAVRYWETVDGRPSYPKSDGVLTEQLFRRPWAEEGIGAAAFDDFETMADHARPSGPRFFAYVMGSGEPVGALGDLLASALNPNTSSWRSAPAAVTIEQSVVGWIAEAVGCEGFRGYLCGGGSTANLMGLAMAREAKAPANETGARPCAVYTSEQAHMSVPKAIAMLGIGRANLRFIPVDDEFRMRIDALEAAIAADRRGGLLPAVIVATAGTVNVGAIDPLEDIAAIARRENLWLHVDGAYGALAALAVPEKFRGLELADSLSLDAHKWLYQPLDCGCLLYRDRETARQTFSDTGDYIRTFSQDPIESFAYYEESIELSRRFRAMKLWTSLQYHGRQAFREAIGRDLAHARMLADEVSARPELELLTPVELSAVCFRHRDRDNAALLKRVIARGRIYISNATIGGQFALRACFVNHRTTEEDVALICREVLAAAEEMGG